MEIFNFWKTVGLAGARTGLGVAGERKPSEEKKVEIPFGVHL